jgi:hypothetical protein
MSHHFHTTQAKQDPRINCCDLYLFRGKPGTGRAGQSTVSLGAAYRRYLQSVKIDSSAMSALVFSAYVGRLLPAATLAERPLLDPLFDNAASSPRRAHSIDGLAQHNRSLLDPIASVHGSVSPLRRRRGEARRLPPDRAPDLSRAASPSARRASAATRGTH